MKMANNTNTPSNNILPNTTNSNSNSNATASGSASSTPTSKTASSTAIIKTTTTNNTTTTTTIEQASIKSEPSTNETTQNTSATTTSTTVPASGTDSSSTSAPSMPAPSIKSTVSSPLSNSDSRWIFPQEKILNSPSRKDNISMEDELSERQEAALFISDLGSMLKVNQLCINTAIIYMHRFYMIHSLKKFQHYIVATACLFFACKVEEQPRRLKDFIDGIQKIFHALKSHDSIALSPEEYKRYGDEITALESCLLQTLGFNVLINHAHTVIIKTCQMIKAPRDLAEAAYLTATNSLILTNFCVKFSSEKVACFCIYLACKWTSLIIPASSEGLQWYHYVKHDILEQELEDISKEYLTIYDTCLPKIQKKLGKTKVYEDNSSESRTSSNQTQQQSTHPQQKPYHHHQQPIHHKKPIQHPHPHHPNPLHHHNIHPHQSGVHHTEGAHGQPQNVNSQITSSSSSSTPHNQLKPPSSAHGQHPKIPPQNGNSNTANPHHYQSQQYLQQKQQQQQRNQQMLPNQTNKNLPNTNSSSSNSSSNPQQQQQIKQQQPYPKQPSSANKPSSSSSNGLNNSINNQTGAQNKGQLNDSTDNLIPHNGGGIQNKNQYPGGSSGAVLNKKASSSMSTSHLNTSSSSTSLNINLNRSLTSSPSGINTNVAVKRTNDEINNIQPAPNKIPKYVNDQKSAS